MGCRVLYDETQNFATLYCSTSDWSFGPVFYGDKKETAEEIAIAFLKHVKPRDPRELGDRELEQKYIDFCNRRTMDYQAGKDDHDYELNRDIREGK